MNYERNRKYTIQKHMKKQKLCKQKRNPNKNFKVTRQKWSFKSYISGKLRYGDDGFYLWYGGITNS